jgi:DNA-binding transcriptional ArsR family regulator
VSLVLNQMVENNVYLDGIFHSLADATRRDMLGRLAGTRYSIGQLAEKYDMSFAAVAKHLRVLEKAKLIRKEKRGNQQIVSIAPGTLRDVSYYLVKYETLWNHRFDALDTVLKEDISE